MSVWGIRITPHNSWIAVVWGMLKSSPRTPYGKAVSRPNYLRHFLSCTFHSFLLIRKISGGRLDRRMRRLRACREREVLPLLNDFVEVLWMLDDENDDATWCNAQVTDVEDAPAPNVNDKVQVLATATLEYEETAAYGAHIHQVEFLVGRLLRGTELEGDKNNNPLLTWRTPVIPQAREWVKEVDEDWTRDDIAENSKRRRVGDQYRVKELADNVDRLRRSNAQILGQVDMLNRKVELNSCRISEGLSSTRDESMLKILNFLRHRLEVAVQKSLRKPSRPGEQTSGDKRNMGTLGGMTQSFIRVVADWELADFELIARNLYGRTVEDSTMPLVFYPEYADTQGPAGTSQTFYIMFNRMAGLCSFLGLYRKAERLAMLKKEGIAGVGLLRLMGTYVYSSDVRAPAAVFVGHSCGNTFERDVASAGSGELELFRNNGIWDSESKTFDAGLRCTRRTPSIVEDPNVSSAVPLHRRAFHLVWRRGQEVSGRWSRGHRKRNVRVPGQVPVVMPYLMFVGDSLCADARRKLNEDAMNEIVSPVQSGTVGQQNVLGSLNTAGGSVE